MKTFCWLIISACSVLLSACGRDLNPAYADPFLAGHAGRQDPQPGLLDPSLRAPPESFGSSAAPGMERDFITGDERAIVRAMPKRPGERYIRGPGASREVRTILI